MLRPCIDAVCCLANQEFPLRVLGESSTTLTFKRRIKSHLPFAGIIRSSPYPRFQDKC